MLWMKYGSRFFILLVHKFFKKLALNTCYYSVAFVLVHRVP